MVRILTTGRVRATLAAATAVALSLSCVFLVLWLRNFWRADVVWGPLPMGGNFVFASSLGQTELALSISSGSAAAVSPTGRNPTEWGYQSYAATPSTWHEILLPQIKPLRYRRLWNNREFNFAAPYWFLIPLTWLCAIAPWLSWSTRFSLRSLIAATTLISIALGIYVSSKW